MTKKSWDTSRKVAKKFNNNSNNNNNKKIIILIFIFLATLACFSIIGYILLKKPDFHNPCSDDYQFFATSGFCYKTYLPIVTRQNALDHCESEGGSLVSIHSYEENIFVRNIYNLTLEKHSSDCEFDVANKTYTFWIGNEYDLYEEGFIWSDGTAHDLDYYKGYEPEPGKIYSVFNTIGYGKWQLVNNSISASYTCKKSIGATFQNRECSPGFTFVKSTGFCYKVFTSHSTFIEASKQCAEQGSNLITIQSKLEHYAVIKLYKKIDITSWEPGKTIDDKWITVGQPNYFSFVCRKPETSKDAIVITIDDETLQTTTPITEVDKSPKACLKGYEYFEETGFCYSINMKPLNFTKATKNCGKENGHLASIHSEEEEQFLLDLAKQHLGTEKEIRIEFYTGLIYNNNRWEWTDGTPVNYADWNSMESNFLLHEKWTSMTYRVSVDHKLSYGWNNMQSFQEGPYFCKKTAKV